ncbi:hypothetical protein BDD30_3482 [Photorhabdus asymbiotica]|uniref:Uncharacterized protein n=1 Tax=Photorhabdus asymbiotica TaxID=291112 RepID=A0ABX9SIB0_9GAMM|nr:hypothetical protein BDD30_3482 [Photorhabdus asymbiotica]
MFVRHMSILCYNCAILLKLSLFIHHRQWCCFV